MLGPSKLKLQVTMCTYPQITDKQQLKGILIWFPVGGYTAQHGRQVQTQTHEAAVTLHLVRKSGPEMLPGSKSPRSSAVSHFLHQGSTS